MQFEVFNKHVAAAAGERRLTIQKGGAITLNTASYAALGRPSAVSLTYDADQHVLTLCAVDRHCGGAVPVNRAGNAPGGPWKIGTSAILRQHDIGTATARRWSPRAVDRCLQIDLDDPRADADQINSPDTFAPDVAPSSRSSLADTSRGPSRSTGEGDSHDRT